MLCFLLDILPTTRSLSGKHLGRGKGGKGRGEAGREGGKGRGGGGGGNLTVGNDMKDDCVYI